MDAIGVGSGTVLADDPMLTVRDCYRLRPLARVVFDRRLRTPPSARLFSTLERRAGHNTDNGGRDRQSTRASRTRFDGPARRSWRAPATSDGHCARWWRGHLDLFLEGGAAMHAAAWQAGIDRSRHVIVAPTVLGEGA